MNGFIASAKGLEFGTLRYQVHPLALEIRSTIHWPDTPFANIQKLIL